MSTKVTVNKGGVTLGGIMFLIVIILMISGAVIEHQYDQKLGATLFSIGFWLLMVPVIIIAVIFGIAIIAILLE